MNETASKFGYPDTLVREYQHWLVLLRPQQVTLGSLVLVCKEPVKRLSDVSAGGFAELREAVVAIESTLGSLFDYQKMNYLMLMMVDPDVHYHVIPRYEQARSYRGKAVVDAGWPGPPSLGKFVELDADLRSALLEDLKKAWPE